MSESFWKPYSPNNREPWNIPRVIHLHRRAAFAATWPEVQRDLRSGPEKSIDRLLAGHAVKSSNAEDFALIADRLGKTAVHSRRIDRLKAW